MPSRCPSCNKFAAYEADVPELVDDPGLEEESGQVYANADLTLSSECCGESLKNGVIDILGYIPLAVIQPHEGDGHELYLEHNDPEQTQVRRKNRNYFGATMSVSLHCRCQKPGDQPLAYTDVSGEVLASELDDMV